MQISNFYISVRRIHIAHEFTIDQQRRCEYPHARGSFGIVYAIDGEAEYRFSAGGAINVKGGDALFLSPGLSYVIATQKYFRHYTVNFDIDVEGSFLGALNLPYYHVKNQRTDTLEHIFKGLVSTYSHKKAGYEMRSVGALYELLSTFYFEYVGGAKGTTDKKIMSAKEYIDRHFNEHIDLSTLAQLFCMSVTSFRREWRRRYDVSPMSYRDSIRLYYAKEYLLCGFYSVIEIAERCGFEDSSYFVRFFKKQTGMTPGEYRKEINGRK